jgi:metal transporter CNNM
MCPNFHLNDVCRSVKYVLDSTPLDECFKTFKTTYNHMLVAVSLKHYHNEADVGYTETDSNILLQAERVISGVITLEDVLEEVIQAEIVDESDQYMSNDMQTKIVMNRHNMDVTSFLSIIHNHYRSQTPELTPQVCQPLLVYMHW